MASPTNQKLDSGEEWKCSGGIVERRGLEREKEEDDEEEHEDALEKWMRWRMTTLERWRKELRSMRRRKTRRKRW
jgi:hypothetical protein